MDKEFKPLEPQQPFGSFVYKKVGNTTISLDVFLPDNLESISTEVRVFLFIHGGAWIAGNRESYCRPLFDEFLSRGYAVITADYRLVPESSFQEQLEDIRDLEQWIRQDLPEVLANRQRGVRCGDIIVAGASAGAHVALLILGSGRIFDIHLLPAPLFLCQSIRYPPVYQIMGSEDSVFECSHVTEFAAALDEQGVPHAEHIVQGADHAFEMSTKPGDTYHLTVFKPAVEWICRYA
ncbi:alpha/beta-hydrolase [Aureobasidium namibiae CBS 147.97]|uniref:Alpha/beta-hydrolase n=1 Tax=Aureobasidium namibiae CBS 147.97 TaxID=1043004 RepID=A0A074W5B4_9PEZI|nr:alpha/beta-hydrolase [Aureobasidium namibiae CBS 147.97]KEQ68320.1 alpha/beta-hydrolase [Aureobasidium namibiae CBS 147.97]